MVTTVLAYVHDLSPFLVQFSEKWGIRWYGLSYVIGFVAAIAVMKFLSRKKCCELEEERVSDFIILGAMLGVMLGGRLGHTLFYNWDEFVQNPAIFFDILGGGMASHGGILGLTIFTWFYARKRKISWAGLGDNLCVAVPIGLFAGRCANFINGELYGRIVTGEAAKSWWAVKFPPELHERELFDNAAIGQLVNRAGQADPTFFETIANPQLTRYGQVNALIECARENEAVEAVIAEVLNPRHASQLYEALGEGLLLFLVLFAIRMKWKNLYHGILTGLFFILYAVVRISLEFVREPDSSLILGLTKGQFYSTFMIVIGAGFIAWAFKTKRRNQFA